jgi:hypothetical protein
MIDAEGNCSGLYVTARRPKASGFWQCQLYASHNELTFFSKTLSFHASGISNIGLLLWNCRSTFLNKYKCEDYKKIIIWIIGISFEVKCKLSVLQVNNVFIISFDTIYLSHIPAVWVNMRTKTSYWCHRAIFQLQY